MMIIAFITSKNSLVPFVEGQLSPPNMPAPLKCIHNQIQLYVPHYKPSTPHHRLILQAPPNSHPFVLEVLVRKKTFFTLLLGVAYSTSQTIHDDDCLEC